MSDCNVYATYGQKLKACLNEHSKQIPETKVDESGWGLTSSWFISCISTGFQHIYYSLRIFSCVLTTFNINFDDKKSCTFRDCDNSLITENNNGKHKLPFKNYERDPELHSVGHVSFME